MYDIHVYQFEHIARTLKLFLNYTIKDPLLGLEWGGGSTQILLIDNVIGYNIEMLCRI